MIRKDKIIRTVTAIIAAAVLICSIVIVTLRLGLVEGYDFGAGAYYYADIPEFEKIMNDEAYRTSVPVWVHILLFLGWGWLMYRLWVWMDSRH
jgi:hypothetical protein